MLAVLAVNPDMTLGMDLLKEPIDLSSEDSFGFNSGLPALRACERRLFVDELSEHDCSEGATLGVVGDDGDRRAASPLNDDGKHEEGVGVVLEGIASAVREESDLDILIDFMKDPREDG